MCLAGLAAGALKLLMQAQQILLCEGGSCIMSLSFHIWIKNNNTCCLKAGIPTLRDTVQTYTRYTTESKQEEIKVMTIKATWGQMEEVVFSTWGRLRGFQVWVVMLSFTILPPPPTPQLFLEEL